MIRIFCARPIFARSRTYRKALCTTVPLSFRESHSLLPDSQSPITPIPHFFNAVSTDGRNLPTYRIVDGVGNVIEGAELPEVCP
jgi:2-oxoisovalerate dehydrogenase E1 component alpha subunit